MQPAKTGFKVWSMTAIAHVILGILKTSSDGKEKPINWHLVEQLAKPKQRERLNLGDKLSFKH